MLSRFSVKKPYTVLVSVVLVLVLGIVSFTGMTTDLFPEIELPYIIVITTYPGADPEKVEATVTRPIEAAVGTTGGISHITSTSTENFSMVMLEFEEGTNMDAAMIELSGNLDIVSGGFDDIISTPALLRMSPDMLPIMQISVDRDNMNLQEISNFVNEDIIPRLERIEGVASASATGIINTQIDVTINQSKIDNINQSVLNSVDEELANAGVELNDARNEIVNGIAELEDGKTELDTQSETVSDELSVASAEIDIAAAQLASTVAQETVLLTNQMAFTAEKAAIEEVAVAYDTVNALMPTVFVPIIEGALQGYIYTTITNNAASVDLVANGIQRPPYASYTEAYTAYTTYQIIALQKDPTLDLPVLPPVIPSDIGLLADIDPDVFNLIIAAIDSALNSPTSPVPLPPGFDTSMLTSLTQENLIMLQQASERLPQIEAELNNINTQLLTIEAMKPQLEDALNQLKTAYAELESGKMLATTGFASGQAGIEGAKLQLDSALIEIDSALEDFEEQRDAALKQADISGIITSDTIQGILMAQNFALPAGYINEDGIQYLVKVGDEFQSVNELENTLLFDFEDIEDVGNVLLKDVADVMVIENSENGYAIINGNDGVILSLQKQSVASTSTVSSLVNNEIEELMQEYEGLHITNLMDQGDYIDIIVNSVLNNLIYGGLLAVFVLILFLKDWRPTLIIAISIPFSLLCAITAMYFTNVSLNLISLSGLALGVGMLVDNSIVVIENIYRLRVQGVNPARAAIQGAIQVSGAIFASTLTTVCVFLPIVFTEGITRSLFEDMGLTIGYSLLASLFVALTLVPTLGATLMKNSPQKNFGWFNSLAKGYTKSLKWALRHKAVVLLFAGGLLAFSVFVALNMGTAFIPSMQSPQMSASVSIPEGYNEEDTKALTRDVAERVEQIEGIDTVGATSGSSDIMSMGMSMGGSGSINLNILLEDGTSVSNEQITNEIVAISEEMGIEVNVQQSTMDISALGGSGIEIVISGQDLDDIQTAAQDVRDILATIPGTIEISQAQTTGNDETRLTVDKNKAMQKGLTIAQVFGELSSALTPETQSTTLTLEGTAYPVMIIPSQEDKITRDNLLDYTFDVTSPTGEESTVKLRDIATVSYAPALTSISRDSGARVMSVTAAVDIGYNVGLISRDVQSALDDYTPPNGIEYRIAGENESITAAFTDMALMILLAVIFIYLIMVAQFQSLLSPFIVMFTILLAFTGGLLALFITGQVLSVVSLIGFLVLAGIVVNNGIVFVDTINQMRISGVSRREAIIETGRLRLRPIIMTALTTILAMLTMALGIGEGAEMTQGLAIVTIGGLLYSTLLTLYVVPVLYDIMRKKEILVIDDSIKSESDIIKDEF